MPRPEENTAPPPTLVRLVTLAAFQTFYPLPGQSPGVQLAWYPLVGLGYWATREDLPLWAYLLFTTGATLWVSLRRLRRYEEKNNFSKDEKT